MWLATCGLEFPEVVAKVISVDAPDAGPIVLHLCTGATPDETEGCKTANMEVKVPDQPDAKRVKPEDGLRFDATLVGYDAESLHASLGQGQGQSGRHPGPGKATPKKLSLGKASEK